MSTLEDIILIQQFVQDKGAFLHNQSLYVESAPGSLRLLTKSGCLLATTKDDNNKKIFLVRQESEYWQLINKILLENSHMPSGNIGLGLVKYEYCQIPQGYEMNYEEARILWKSWRMQESLKSSDNLQTHLLADLLIETKRGWQPIEDIVFSKEIIFVKTNTEEILLSTLDKVVWLSLLPKQLREKPVSKHSETLQIKNVESQYNFTSENSLKDDTGIGDNKQQPNNIISDPFENIRGNCNVLSIYQGKLYIQTIEGEIVVEGENLKFWFTPEEGENITPLPVEIR